MMGELDQLKAELAELKQQLTEANDTIYAIQNGQVDALIINDPKGQQLYTLRSADQTYRIFIEKMSEGAVTLDDSGIILYANSSFSNKLSLDSLDVIGRKFLDYVEEADKEHFEALFDVGWKREIKAEISLKRQSSEPIPFNLSFASLELEEGTSLSIILTDLSDQKLTQSKLKQQNEQLEQARATLIELNNNLEQTVANRTHELQLSQEYFKLMANSMPQMCWTSDLAGEVDFFNQRWYEYTGYNFQSLKGLRFQNVIHPDDLQFTMERYFQALRSGETFVVENRYLGVDGSYRWHLNRGMPVRNAAGKVVMWVATATDIDDQRKAMERKDEFIGMASHELKTPITGIKGYLQLVTNYKKQELPPMVTQFIGRANQSLKKLENLVDDLLDVSKIQAGKLEFKQEKVNVERLLKVCQDNARLIFPDQKIQISAHQELYVWGNEERLEQVLMNFISNAVKYGGDKEQIIVTAELEDDDVCISVRDFGIGLSDIQKTHVFERFYRVEDKTFSASGLGMGLYISAEIIQAHHGMIGVESKIGKGSTFYFSLPRYA